VNFYTDWEESYRGELAEGMVAMSAISRLIISATSTVCARTTFIAVASPLGHRPMLLDNGVIGVAADRSTECD
jgi:hypothetical protein